MVLLGDGSLLMVGSDSFRIVDIVSYQFAIINKIFALHSKLKSIFICYSYSQHALFVLLIK